MDIYREEVLDHCEHPRNRGELVGDGITVESVSNASCGDSIQFYLRVAKVPNTRVPQGLPAQAGSELRIMEVKWQGIGCAIMTASASKLSEYLQGQALKDLRKMSEEELIKTAIGFEVNAGRSKCLMLPVKAVKNLLGN